MLVKTTRTDVPTDLIEPRSILFTENMHSQELIGGQL